MLNQRTITNIFEKLSGSIPNPTCELDYHSHFELLIAVILSARTTDKIVNKIISKLFAAANSPEKMLKLGISGIKEQIKSSGFFNSKAKHIIQACELLVQNFNSQVPKTRIELESLPGVGRKTANVILNTAFHQPTIAVDTHVFRVANRTGLAQGKTPIIIETELLKIVPEKFAQTAGHLLLLHGRYVCLSQKPKCAGCVICKFCQYKFKNFPHF